MNETSDAVTSDHATQERRNSNTNVDEKVIRYRTPFSNTVCDVMGARGWEKVSETEAYDVHWCDVGWLRENFDNTYFPKNVSICHFRNHYELTRKNYMVKNLKRLKKQIEKACQATDQAPIDLIDFFPITYELPNEYHLFVEEFKKERLQYENSRDDADAATHMPTWIMKPVGRAQGKGIFLFRKLKDIQDWKRKEIDTQYAANNTSSRTTGSAAPNATTASTERPYLEGVDPASGTSVRERISMDQQSVNVETYVVSRYIDNPYLIMGKKFDIRMYVLVTSFSPLVAWTYREGFARFSNQRFNLDSIDNNIVHLTNVAIQKTAQDYDPEKGAKWSLQSLRNFIAHKHGHKKSREVFNQMTRIVIRSLQSVKKSIISDKHCFELYGYDLLLDDKMKMWLVEVNASPSLTASSKDDYEMKFGLIWDTLDVIDMEQKRTGKERRVGGFDLIWNEEPNFDKTVTERNQPQNTRAQKEKVHNRDFHEHLKNYAVHMDPIIHNSALFKQVPTFPTNAQIGCPYDKQKLVLDR